MIYVTFIEVDFNAWTHSYYYFDSFANLINVADILI
jgi:hypothetical protein